MLKGSLADAAALKATYTAQPKGCQKGTRLKLLEEIVNWAVKGNSKVLWLQGMAGTGKSAVACSVCQRLAELGLLGAGFFFKRGGGDQATPDKFFATIAHQLLSTRRSTESHIIETINKNNGIIRSDAKADDQFEQLILQPLRSSNGSTQNSQTTIIVIDALDECVDSETTTISDVLRLLNKAMVEHCTLLKVFITSRLENRVKRALDSTHIGPEVLPLDDINRESGAEDIKLFLDKELERIRDCYGLASGWPGSDSVDRLVARADRLFIFAATAVLFIEDEDIADPEGNLKSVLDPQKKFQGSRLDATYTPILDQLLRQRTPKGVTPRSKNDREIITKRFRKVLGSIILLAEPLSAVSLAELLGIPLTEVKTALVSLRSVLKIPSDNNLPIELLHLSFRDFLVDEGKDEEYLPFWVDERKHHARLAHRCLKVLKEGKHLTKDICKLGKLGTTREKITRKRVDEHLPAHVQYACLYWVHHWKEGSKEKSDAERGDMKGDNMKDGPSEEDDMKMDDESPVDVFLRTHFLHWLEALGLLGKATDSINMISQLLELANVRPQSIPVSHITVYQGILANT